MAINAGKNFVSGALNGKFNASCFAVGTMIETADGDRPIEEIQIGMFMLRFCHKMIFNDKIKVRYKVSIENFSAIYSIIDKIMLNYTKTISEQAKIREINNKKEIF